ncbi:F-box protein at3g07870 [Phtheirospermum japonicum]|uniref:F-box protein at3g07870 n=1 Tax=Phtheirospermum japonicum TaxID=374723 RepID=A0A830DDZ3_9LAMI|nr:F-box protein at3g07870 [Phtheirospermum japonicum]
MASKNEGQIKKATHQNEKDDSYNGFDRLPNEIAIDTLSRLPITYLVQLSYACRSLNSLSHDPDFVSLHLSKSSTNENECLVTHSVYPLRNQLHFIGLSDKKVDSKIIIDLICLYNPFRRDHFESFKNFEIKDQSVAYDFGFHPIAIDYKILSGGGTLVIALDRCLSDVVPKRNGNEAFSIWIMRVFGVNESSVNAYNVTHYFLPGASRNGETTSHQSRN